MEERRVARLPESGSCVEKASCVAELGEEYCVAIYRLFKGKKWPPAMRDGCFVMGDPAAGAQKHHARNQILVRSEEEAVRLIRKGSSIRIETETSPSLVRRNLYHDGVPIS